ncbi:MAG: TRAP transporter large permease [Atribacterota bacterium]|nr:TRAP transporter large permease [Atribacterota bacterium]
MSGLLFITFLITLFSGMPIAFALGISAFVFFTQWGGVPMDVIAHRFFDSINQFVLLSIPFFILAGEIMNKTGITKNLVEFAYICVGKLRGGLAHANILASILFAGLTGAGVSDTSALGSILIPAMKEKGFEADYSAAVTAASSVIGPIIPPSIIMVVFGSIMGISVGSLFAAGFVPGILIGIGLMIMAYIISSKRGHPRRTEPVKLKEFLIAFKDAFLALLMPIIIIGGILGGVFTPTEAAAIAVAYGLIIGFFVYRTLKLSDLPECLLKSAITTSIILLIIGFANVFGWALAIERIPQQLARFFISMGLNKITFLLVVNGLLLFMGMIMETGANAILLGPVLMPVAVQLGINPLHFAMIMLVNLNIGLATPPLGVCLFVAAPIAEISLEKLSKAIFPFLAVEVIVLLFLTYIPELTLIVPRLIGFID